MKRYRVGPFPVDFFFIHRCQATLCPHANNFDSSVLSILPPPLLSYLFTSLSPLLATSFFFRDYTDSVPVSSPYFFGLYVSLAFLRVVPRFPRSRFRSFLSLCPSIHVRPRFFLAFVYRLVGRCSRNRLNDTLAKTHCPIARKMSDALRLPRWLTGLLLHLSFSCGFLRYAFAIRERRGGDLSGR